MCDIYPQSIRPWKSWKWKNGKKAKKIPEENWDGYTVLADQTDIRTESTIIEVCSPYHEKKTK
jgi:hypothetical protein